MSSKIVCYLFTGFDDERSLLNFIKHYKKYKPGIKHSLLICYKLVHLEKINKYRNFFKKIKHIEFIDSEKKNDWDFGSYKRVSKYFYDNDILFLNSHSYPVCMNWLKKLFLYKKKNTVIAPTASYESMVDSIKLKNKYHKIIRYIIRKYRFSKNFDKFPNPHLRTSSFLINSKTFYNYIKNKKLNNKEDTLKIESGKNSLTKYLIKEKFKILVVNSDGKKYNQIDWKKSETYMYKSQSKNIISDKYTRIYDKLSLNNKRISEKNVWG